MTFRYNPSDPYHAEMSARMKAASEKARRTLRKVEMLKEETALALQAIKTRDSYEFVRDRENDQR